MKAVFLLVAGCQTAGTGPAGHGWKAVDGDSLALRIDCGPEEAEVRMNGVLQGSCKLLSRPGAVLRLPAGTHELEVAAAGYRSFRSTISGSGVQESLTVRLVPFTPRATE